MRADLLLRGVRLDRDVSVSRAEYRLDVARLEAVREVVHLQLARRRNRHRAELVAREHRRPELEVALQYEHHLVALADPERLHVVRDAVGLLHHVLEREAPLAHVRGDVQHREAVGVLLRDLVNYVEREVELVLVLEADMLELALSVLLALDELLREKRLVRLAAAHPDHRQRLLLRVAGHDHRDKLALLPADGDHSVRRRRVVEYRVARVQRLLVVSHLHAHRAGHDVVELLARVRRRVYRHLLLALVVVVCHEVRSREAALEHRRHVADEDALLVHRHRTLPRAVDLEVGELGRVALEKRRDVDPERKRALVQERERRIHRPRLDRHVVPLVDVRKPGHLGGRLAAYLAQLLDARRHLSQLVHLLDSVVFFCLLFS